MTLNATTNPEAKTKKVIANTSIIYRDLTKHAPHNPRERIAGFAIASTILRSRLLRRFPELPKQFGDLRVAHLF
jgi:hypothetical protein